MSASTQVKAVARQANAKAQAVAATVSAPVAGLSVWKAALTKAFKVQSNASAQVFALVMEARAKGFDHKEVRDSIKESVLAAGGSTDTAKVRACEAGVILSYEGELSTLPANLQQAASAIRKTKKAQAVATPEKGAKVTDTVKQKADAMKALRLALDRVKGLTSNKITLALLTDMATLADDIAESSDFVAAKPAA